MTGPALRLLDAASALVRHAMGRSHCAILVYHEIDPNRFAAHLDRLQRLYRVVPMGRLVDAIERRDWSDMPPRSLVIHFDDGLRSFVELEPVLRRSGVPVTHFVLPGTVGTHRRGWWTLPTRREINHLKRVPDPLRLRFLRERFGHEPTREYPDRQFLSWEEVRRLAGLGVEFGAHSLSHPQLPMCDAETAWREVAESRRQLEEGLGGPVGLFAYPSGAYGDREVELVRRAGFRAARTMDRGWNGLGTDLFRLRDLEAGDGLSPEALGHLELISIVARLRRALGRLRARLRPLPDPRRVLGLEEAAAGPR